MKFAVLAALFATSSAVKINDDCKGDWCNKGLPYDLDKATLDKAQADNDAKTAWYEHTKLAKEIAENAHAAATAAAQAAAAGNAKLAAASDFAATPYKDATFPDKEAANKAAVKAKEGSLEASYVADDDLVAKMLVMERRTS